MRSNDKAMELLLELGNPAARRTRNEVLDVALRTALALTEADGAAILAPSNRRAERLVLHAGSASPALVPVAAQGSEVARTMVEGSPPVLLADLSEDALVFSADSCPGVEAGPAMFSALRLRDPVSGYVAVYRRRGRARFALHESRAMVLLTAWVGGALESLRLSSGVEKLTLTDDVTQVYNARFLKAALRRELRRAGRFGQELSLLLVDVDQREAFVAEHGDLRGSLLLKEVASLLAQQVRSFDLMARAGGDRFVLVLPQTPRDGAIEVAERMRAAVERHAFSFGAPGATTVSVGVASFPQEGADSAPLLASVERALDQARQRGMNCVETLAKRAA